LLNKFPLEYIVSACGWGIFPNGISDYAYKTETIDSLLEFTKILQKKTEESCKNIQPIFSCLFNAYTEKNSLEIFKDFKNLGMNSLYTDSGGLQIVTAGKEITDEIKNDVFEVQSNSDYAMCFDVIPLSSFSLVRTRNERSNIGNKIFNQDDHKESGTATGKNIKQQIEKFKKLGSKTKIIAIAQGNCAEDMVEYFLALQKELTEASDFDYIGGIAMADTCIGNGPMESVEMLRGAKLIARVAELPFMNQLHILGVGSLHRMRPVLYLVKSGYLNEFKKISYDSSSHTCTFNYGAVKLDGTCKRLGSNKEQKGINHFKNVYDLFSDHLSKLVTFDDFIFSIYGFSGDWAYSSIRDRALKNDDKKMAIAGLLSKCLHTYFQMNNFVLNCDKMLSATKYIKTKGGSKKVLFDLAISNLLNVKTNEDMTSWMKNFKSSVKSSRILREENHNTLESLFEN